MVLSGTCTGFAPPAAGRGAGLAGKEIFRRLSRFPRADGGISPALRGQQGPDPSALAGVGFALRSGFPVACFVTGFPSDGVPAKGPFPDQVLAPRRIVPHWLLLFRVPLRGRRLGLCAQGATGQGWPVERRGDRMSPRRDPEHSASDGDRPRRGRRTNRVCFFGSFLCTSKERNAQRRACPSAKKAPAQRGSHNQQAPQRQISQIPRARSPGAAGPNHPFPVANPGVSEEPRCV